MEQKCLKSDIYINENLLCDSFEQAIDVDFTLPDYCPDISKIFKCHAVPRITSKSITGTNVTIEGNAIITVLYCDKEGGFHSYEYNYPFSKNIELNQDGTGANICCKIKCDYINCRAVTGRKIDLHGAIGINVRIFKRKGNEIICDLEESGVEIKKYMAPTTVPMGFAEKYLIIEEDIPISGGQPAIENILKVNSAVCVKETKLINDKAVVKGEVVLCILYSPEGQGVPQAVKTTLPYSQIIDIEGVTDSCKCECKAEISALDIKPKVSSLGEVKCFSLNIKLLLTCEAYCSNEIPIIEDAFSRKFEAEILRKTLPFNKLSATVSESYNCKKGIELDFNINSVIDLWCSLQSCHTKFEEEKMIISGALLAGMLICDENNIPVFIEKPIEFEYKYPFVQGNGVPRCEPEIEIISCNFTIVSANKIDLQVQISINAGIYEKKETALVYDVSINKEKPISRNQDGAMVIYFPEKEDTVWSIANKYSASVEEIKRINCLENQEIDMGKMILIPIN